MPTDRVIKPGDLAWNRFSAMSCDTEGENAGDGLLTREELKSHVLRLEAAARIADDYMIDMIDSDLTEASRALRDMDMLNADAIAYLPENCRALDVALRKRVTDILKNDDKDAYGEITPELIDRARYRWRNMPGVPMMNAHRNREEALAELDRLEAALFPR